VSNTNTNVLPKMLAKGVLALRQQARGPSLVNRDYESIAAQKGNVINVPIPSAIAARAVTASVVMNSNVASAPTVALVTLDHWMEAPFEMTDNDFVSVVADFEVMQASEAIKSLANDADSYLYGKGVGVFGAVGVAGTTPSTIGTFSQARKLLNKQLAPVDGRFGILDPDSENALLTMSPILLAQERGDQGAVIGGTVGHKLGFDWYMDQNVSAFTPGTGWVTGWAISTNSAVVGQNTLTILNATASGTVLVGDIFTIGGAAQQYVITTAAQATATTGLAITFYPALAAGTATGVAITVIATAYVQNLAAHKNAFAWASRPLGGVFSAGNIFQAPTDPISGIALRLELSRQYKLDTYSFDYLAGAGLIRRELAVKILG
jgi:coat protein Gp5